MRLREKGSPPSSTDLSKAFDTVSHDLLLSKLEAMGFHKSCTNWLRTYLDSRSQVTKLGNTSSTVEKVVSGVPQGSILGPILFIAFTADFASSLPNCKVVAYADDAAILTSANSLCALKTKIEESIAQAQKWYNSNGLLINADKSEVMVMGKNHQIEVAVKSKTEETTIKSVSQLKVLGVYLDSKLNWIPHIRRIKSRASNPIRMIARSRSVLPLTTRKLLVDALVIPHYNYCDVLYDGCSTEGKHIIQRSQNYAAKSLLGMRRQDSATAAREKLGWIDLEARRKVHLGVFLHKAAKGNSSEHAKHMFEQRLANHRHNTRSRKAGKLNSITHSTALFERSVSFRGVQAWNTIPETIKGNHKTKSFKTALQNFYLDKSLHSHHRSGTR